MQAIRRKDDIEDVLQRKWLKWAYMGLEEPRHLAQWRSVCGLRSRAGESIECGYDFFCFGRGSNRHPHIVFKLVYLVVHFVNSHWNVPFYKQKRCGNNDHTLLPVSYRVSYPSNLCASTSNAAFKFSVCK